MRIAGRAIVLRFETGRPRRFLPRDNPPRRNAAGMDSVVDIVAPFEGTLRRCRKSLEDGPTRGCLEQPGAFSQADPAGKRLVWDESGERAPMQRESAGRPVKRCGKGFGRSVRIQTTRMRCGRKYARTLKFFAARGLPLVRQETRAPGHAPLTATGNRLLLAPQTQLRPFRFAR
jgi:hypothetical protein